MKTTHNTNPLHTSNQGGIAWICCQTKEHQKEGVVRQESGHRTIQETFKMHCAYN